MGPLPILGYDFKQYPFLLYQGKKYKSNFMVLRFANNPRPPLSTAYNNNNRTNHGGSQHQRYNCRTKVLSLSLQNIFSYNFSCRSRRAAE